MATCARIELFKEKSHLLFIGCKIKDELDLMIFCGMGNYGMKINCYIPYFCETDDANLMFRGLKLEAGYDYVISDYGQPDSYNFLEEDEDFFEGKSRVTYGNNVFIINYTPFSKVESKRIGEDHDDCLVVDVAYYLDYLPPRTTYVGIDHDSKNEIFSRCSVTMFANEGTLNYKVDKDNKLHVTQRVGGGSKMGYRHPVRELIGTTTSSVELG